MAAVSVYFYTQVKPILISEINKSLAVEVKVQDISISSLRDFPKLGLKFSGVQINESTPYFKKNLLTADDLSLFVNVFKIYKSEYSIDAITLRSAELNIADLENGTNYDILKPTDDSESSPVTFEIKSLKLIDCKILYNHVASKYKTNAYCSSSDIGLKYTENITRLDIDAGFEQTTMVYNKDTLVSDKKLKINSLIDINTSSELINLTKSALQIANVKLSIDGEVSYADESKMDIRFGNKTCNINDIVSVLPKNLIAIFDEIDLGGEMKVDGSIKGKTYGNSPLALNLNLQTQNTSLKLKGQPISFEKIQATGDLTIDNLDDLNTAQANLKIAQAQSGKNEVSGLMSIKNFNTPHIFWDGSSNLGFDYVLALSADTSIRNPSGRISSDGILKLTYDIEKEMLVPHSLNYDGDISFQKLSGYLIDSKIQLKNISADIKTTGSDAKITNGIISYNETTGKLTGILKNYETLFDESSDALLEGNLALNNLNVNDWTQVSDTNTNGSQNSTISPLDLNLFLNVNEFSYNDFRAQKLAGRLRSDDGDLTIPNCEILALEGKTKANLSIRNWGENYLLNINSDVSKINIAELFRQFNNFEQSELTNEHLSGVLSGKIIAKVILNRNYEPVLPKLYAKIDVTIENGALTRYEPLQELSSFVHIEDLKNVKFKTLKNEIEIFDQTIFIPRMMIKNSALNLEIEGTHTFENYMEYNLGLSVAELLATKAKWIAKKNEKRIEKNPNGGLTAYIVMKGTPDDLEIKYDRATVKENVREEAKREKVKLLKALKGEGNLEEDESKKKNYDNVWDE